MELIKGVNKPVKIVMEFIRLVMEFFKNRNI